jgi:hypothetical protein
MVLGGVFRAGRRIGEPSDPKPATRASCGGRAWLPDGGIVWSVAPWTHKEKSRPEGGRGFRIWAMVAAIYVAGQSGVFRA